MNKLFIVFLLLPLFSYKSTFSGEDIFFGDSITFGNELGPLQYTARWSSQYCAVVPSNEQNYAASGASMIPGLVGGRPSFNPSDVPNYQSSYNHIFVSYWVNDYLYGANPNAFAGRALAAVNGILAKGWPADKIVLCFNYLPESGSSTWPYLTHDIALQWLAALRSVQQNKRTSFLDFYTFIYNHPDKASYSGDGIHPTAAWNAIMKSYALTNIEAPVSTLPVMLQSFSGKSVGAKNILEWTVTQESDLRAYVVEKSVDGRNWLDIGSVNSLGATTQQRTYTFADDNARGLKQLYRLRMVDINGAAKASNIISISGVRPTVLSLAGLFPNPAGNKVNLLVDAPVKENITIMATDAVGRLIKTQRALVDAGSNTVQMDVAGLAKGSYLLRVSCEKDCQPLTIKFVKE
ncbi:MAG TPA: GDSL-type esterase/lipase family protein [Flavisolibacter sp.]|nr:GDSL-type esterase/lipase family protein [Flavisolibacter sp.]